jgi:hypothetical protein
MEVELPLSCVWDLRMKACVEPTLRLAIGAMMTMGKGETMASVVVFTAVVFFVRRQGKSA